MPVAKLFPAPTVPVKFRVWHNEKPVRTKIGLAAFSKGAAQRMVFELKEIGQYAEAIPVGGWLTMYVTKTKMRVPDGSKPKYKSVTGYIVVIDGIQEPRIRLKQLQQRLRDLGEQWRIVWEN